MHISLRAPSRSRFVNVFIWSTVLALVAISTFFVYSTSQAAAVNLALNRPAVASSKYSGSYDARYVNDGNLTTRWASTYSDPQWVYVDLGTSRKIERVVLKWEKGYGKSYSIQVSDDTKIWKPIYTTTSSDGGTDDITLSGTGRYVLMYGTKRATQWGYSLYEFEVYGTEPAPTVSLVATPTTITQGQSATLAWSSTNAASCAGTGFTTSNAMSGSIKMSPTATTTYRLSCSGAGGTTQTSAVVNVAPLPPKDTAAPTVSLTSPLNNAAVSGTTTISVNASDNVGIVGVEFKLDGGTLLRDEKIVPYSFAWSSFSVSDGTHTIVAVARDAAGNRATSTPVTVTVKNAPTATITATPNSIMEGQSSVLSWTSTKALSCTGIGFVTGNAVSGSVTVTPTATTTYSISCTGPGGNANASVTVNVTLVPPLTASCAATPTTALTGAPVTWTAAVSGGTGVYTYSWSGTDGISGSNNPLNVTYATAGTKSAQVIVKSGPKATTALCSNTVAISAPDTTPPSTVGGVAVTAVSSSQIKLTWNASVDAESGVSNYEIRRCVGTTCIPSTVGTLVGSSTTTSFNDTGLAANTTYRYQVRAVSRIGLFSNFNTNVKQATTFPLAVALTSPIDAAIVGETVLVSANASADVIGVQFKLNNADLGTEDTLSPYTLNWGTLAAPDGSHTLLAVARDVGGNIATSAPITVTVRNAPTASFSANSTTITEGQSTTLVWSTAKATSCIGGGFDAANATSGSVTVAPTATTTYTISCTGAGGTIEANVTVNVILMPIVKFQMSDRIRVNTGSAPLNVRDSANGTLVGQQDNGAFGAVIAGPIYANSLWWWNVDYDTGPDGWSAQDFLISDLPPLDLLPMFPDNPSGLF